MKKKILAAVMVAALVGVALFQGIPALAQLANPLDHVVITPSGTTLPAGGAQQFSAQAYDSSNQILSNVTYFWLVTAGGGTINTTGLFTAGGIPGTYTGTVEVVAVQGNLTRVATASVVVTGTAGPLDHVMITPSNATVAPGSNQQFTAQGYDANNIPVAGLVYTWSVVAGGGTIDSTGLFTAGTATGTFTNTVQVIAYQGSITKTGFATVVVSTTSPSATTATATISGLDTSRLIKIFSNYLNRTGFGNFLGGQWQVKNTAGITETINAVPGVVQSFTPGSSLTIIQNGQSTSSTLQLASNTIIWPKGASLASGDDVVVFEVNGQVDVVAKIAPVAPAQMPPGLRNHNGGREGKQTPPGWSHGKKTGWGRSPNSSSESNDD